MKLRRPKYCKRCGTLLENDVEDSVYNAFTGEQTFGLLCPQTKKHIEEDQARGYMLVDNQEYSFSARHMLAVNKEETQEIEERLKALEETVKRICNFFDFFNRFKARSEEE